MSRENDRGARRHFLQLFDEHSAESPQPVNNVSVVHDLVPNINRPSEQLDRALDDIYRPIDAGAESARIGEQNFHAADYPPSEAAFLPPSPNTMSSTAPTQIAESAMLNAGHDHCR